MKNIRILNIDILNIKLNNLLNNFKRGVVFTPNVDHLIMLQRDKEFYDCYQEADYLVCDSKLVQIASSFLGVKIIEKISGSDFFPAFYTHHKDNESIKIFLLGAMDNIAEKATKNINESVGRKIIVDYLSPSYGFETNKEECQNIINQINRSNATVLAVGVGTPKQEKWIIKYKDQMPNIKIFMAIGATIDFEAGQIKRSPRWMSNMGIEWLYRLLSEPRRLWKRYLIDDIPFFYLILKQKLGLYNNPFNNKGHNK